MQNGSSSQGQMPSGGQGDAPGNPPDANGMQDQQNSNSDSSTGSDSSKSKSTSKSKSITFINVDLPEPDGPSMATNSPSSTVKLISFKTCNDCSHI